MVSADSHENVCSERLVSGGLFTAVAGTARRPLIHKCHSRVSLFSVAETSGFGITLLANSAILVPDAVKPASVRGSHWGFPAVLFRTGILCECSQGNTVVFTAFLLTYLGQVAISRAKAPSGSLGGGMVCWHQRPHRERAYVCPGRRVRKRGVWL